MKKSTLITHVTALLAANIALADQTPIAPQQQQNPSAVAEPNANHKMAYGCVGSGDGQFQGKRDCQGGVVDGCVGSGQNGNAQPQASPCMPAATPCSTNGGCNPCNPCVPCNGCAPY
ncbi:MAG: hypothetical protein A3F10_01105 [Coxiella sp. RIFCSPHIGHO2_12_FULL_42_15]|nr:MAG: hypothetical protein A3F10_01105 [Coxiella sp. RIFCSPHIGHO2_12_FULL_42_15]